MTEEQQPDSSRAILWGASDAVAALPRPWRIAGQSLMALGIGIPAIGSLLGFPFAATFTLQMASLTAALLILRKAGAVRLPFVIAFAAIPIGFFLAYLVRSWQ